jgi:hypothetical protein
MYRPHDVPPSSGQNKTYPPGRIVWGDDKLACLDADQLKNLLRNLGMQRAIGRVTAADALDLARRITARLPAAA